MPMRVGGERQKVLAVRGGAGTGAVAGSESAARVEEGEHSSLSASKMANASAGEFGPCRTCVFVLERVKKGTNMLLPSICSEVYDKFPSSYGTCHQVLNALTVNGGNIKYWLFEGCYKYEIYQAKEWVKPCPSHVMCAALEGLDKSKFCTQMAMEDPFGADGGAGSGAAAKQKK
eukprot:CAMPEP_0170185800 /NCGR_PEP_ID=MMETSP0040_2-20121228/37481_1 /TAXON_ID=641309 /ORGANISM="Lotharella oceanica, Strain CCMP622" /LENGTH=173 /DNA_ID=CAMNT_0010432315 /DNA_START=84 /DNA_END=605 /DNA_ORIENTATION=-